MHQDTGKIEEVEKETVESTVVIPKMEAEVVRLTEQLGEEEKALESLQEGCKGTNFHFRHIVRILITHCLIFANIVIRYIRN